MIWLPEFIYRRLPLFYGLSGIVFFAIVPGAFLSFFGVLLFCWSVYIRGRRIATQVHL